MTLKAPATIAAVTLGLVVSGCGASSGTSTVGPGGKPAASIQLTKAPAVNEVALVTGSAPQQITATIQAFYRATWQNHGPAACSLFSPAGERGFMAAATVAFPETVNTTTTCPQVMAYFAADLSDSADNLQQSGVNVSGNILDKVGVSHIKISGSNATAQAPEGVEEFIKPKIFLLTHTGGRWLISGSKKIGQTLAQMLAAAKAQGKLYRKSTP